MTLSVDSSARSITVVASAVTVTLSTNDSNDVIVVFTYVSNNVTVSSITGTNGLSWTQRMSQYTGGGPRYLEEWWAPASGTLSSATIIVNFSGAPGASVIQALAINGANTTTPYDVNVSLPGQAESGTGSATSLTASGISTTNANTILLGICMITSGGGSISAPAALTHNIFNGGAERCDYQVVSSAESSASFQYSWTSGASDASMIIDAIQAPSTAFNDPLWFGMTA